jgi:hypothetical protein
MCEAYFFVAQIYSPVDRLLLSLLLLLFYFCEYLMPKY